MVKEHLFYKHKARSVSQYEVKISNVKEIIETLVYITYKYMKNLN